MTFLNLLIDSFFIIFFINFFYIFFFHIYILSKEEKEKKRQCGRERYKNLSEDEKQKLLEYKSGRIAKKHSIIILRKYFNLENFASL